MTRLDEVGMNIAFRNALKIEVNDWHSIGVCYKVE